MRRHCMSIFHYVAEQIKDMPLFEHSVNLEEEDGDGRGESLYNDFDFDFDSASLLNTSQQNNVEQQNEESLMIPRPSQDIIDHALLEADAQEGIFYDANCVASPYFDCESESTNPNYLINVMMLVADELESIELSEETLNAFRIRHRNDWQGADSIFDAWLILNSLERSWFSMSVFEDFLVNYRSENEDESSTESNKRKSSTSDETYEEDEECATENMPQPKRVRTTTNESSISDGSSSDDSSSDGSISVSSNSEGSNSDGSSSDGSSTDGSSSDGSSPEGLISSDESACMLSSVKKKSYSKKRRRIQIKNSHNDIDIDSSSEIQIKKEKLQSINFATNKNEPIVISSDDDV